MSKFHALLVTALLLAPVAAHAADDSKEPPKVSAADIKKIWKQPLPIRRR